MDAENPNQLFRSAGQSFILDTLCASGVGYGVWAVAPVSLAGAPGAYIVIANGPHAVYCLFVLVMRVLPFSCCVCSGQRSLNRTVCLSRQCVRLMCVYFVTVQSGVVPCVDALWFII